VAQHTTHLAHALAGAGHDVILESWSRLYPARLWPGDRGVLAEPEVPPFPATRRNLSWRRLDGWWRAGVRFRREGADGVLIVVATPLQVPPYLLMLAAARSESGRKSPPRIVAVCHNVLPHERRLTDRPLMGALLSRLNGVVVHAPAQIELARRFTRASVLLAALPPHLPEPAQGPAGSPIPPDAAVHGHLLFFGAVRPYKGLDLLLTALTGLPEVRLTVAGEFWGDGLARTQRLVTELGLQERIRLLPGYVEAADVPALFHSVDALVLPYRSGTASQNAHLAHSHGVPVVATRVGTLATDIRDGVDGVLCAASDIGALTAALRSFYTPGTAQRLRAGVRPADAAAMWNAYVATLVGALGCGVDGEPGRPAFADHDGGVG
jgi:glycosyltransferase involved in cell wall biosynthesis